MPSASSLSSSVHERIIVALDVATEEEALRLVKELPEVRWFKVGLELFTAWGPSLIETIREKGHSIFLDLKLHDIPNTVAGAVRSAMRHGVAMLTVHASGGKDMMRRAVEVAVEEAERRGILRPKLIAVTVLTSLTDSHLQEMGIADGGEAQVLRLASLAHRSGVDGAVCSPREISLLRDRLGEKWLIVTPGIRPLWAGADDQQRVLTPREAFTLGADYLVIGRPITASPSPREAFLRIIAELESAGHTPDRKDG